MSTYEISDGVALWRYGSPWLRRIFGTSVMDALVLPHIIRDLHREHGFDVVVVHHAYAGYAFVRAGLTIPLVYMFHASIAREAEVEGFRRFRTGIRTLLSPLVRALFIPLTRHVESRVLARAAIIALFSEFSRTVLKETYPKAAHKAERIPMGIDTARFKPAKSRAAVRTALHLDPDVYIFITARRLTLRMGLRELMVAMAEVVKQMPHAQLLLIGEGPLRSVLGQDSARLHLADHVTMLGRVSDIALVEYYQAADCFVLPTQAFEGFGMATAEALSCGVPVIGTPVGATPEILTPINPGLLMKSVHAADIAEAMLAHAHMHAREKSALGRKARAHMVREFTPKRAVAAFEHLLEKAIASAKRV